MGPIELALLSLLAICDIIVCLKVLHILSKPHAEKAPIMEKDKKLDYSEHVLKIVRDISIQTSVLMFRSFSDSHDLSKITKAQIQTLVTDTADRVNESLVFDTIDFESTVFTKEYVELIIVESVVNSIKDLLNKAVDEYNS